MNNAFCTQIHDAIVQQTVLHVTYKPFDAPEMCILFHPYYLKQYNRCWYAFGLNPAEKEVVWNLALERIGAIETTSKTYQPIADDWRWNDYFSDVYGVTRLQNGQVEEVVIHALGKTGHYIEARPLHESQRTKWIDKDTLEVKFRVIVNYEFERLLLSYADNIRIISPKSLQENHRKKLHQALTRYR